MSKLKNLVPRSHPSAAPLLIQKALINGGRTLESLAQEHDLQVLPHPRFPHLKWISNRGADTWNPLVQQCRGLILDSQNRWAVAARAIDHIFEWSHACAPLIDWNDKPRVFDKIDGYMLYLWCYDGGWYVSSRRHPDADDFAPRNEEPLRALFWKALQDHGWKVPPVGFQACTFTWEIRGRLLAPVVEGRTGQKNQLTLLTVRHNESGQEMDPEAFSGKGLRPYCTPWEETALIKSPKDALAAIIDTSLKYNEGYVISDAKGNRIAVTHPNYDAAREYRDKLSLEFLVNLVRASKPITDLHTYAQDWVPLYGIIARSYGDFMGRLYKTAQLHHSSSNEELIEATKHLPWADILIKKRDGIVPNYYQAVQEVDWMLLLEWLEVPATSERAA